MTMQVLFVLRSDGRSLYAVTCDVPGCRARVETLDPWLVAPGWSVDGPYVCPACARAEAERTMGQNRGSV